MAVSLIAGTSEAGTSFNGKPRSVLSEQGQSHPLSIQDQPGNGDLMQPRNWLQVEGGMMALPLMGPLYRLAGASGLVDLSHRPYYVVHALMSWVAGTETYQNFRSRHHLTTAMASVGAAAWAFYPIVKGCQTEACAMANVVVNQPGGFTQPETAITTVFGSETHFAVYEITQLAAANMARQELLQSIFPGDSMSALLFDAASYMVTRSYFLNEKIEGFHVYLLAAYVGGSFVLGLLEAYKPALAKT